MREHIQDSIETMAALSEDSTGYGYRGDGLVARVDAEKNMVELKNKKGERIRQSTEYPHLKFVILYAWLEQ